MAFLLGSTMPIYLPTFSTHAHTHALTHGGCLLFPSSGIACVDESCSNKDWWANSVWYVTCTHSVSSLLLLVYDYYYYCCMHSVVFLSLFEHCCICCYYYHNYHHRCFLFLLIILNEGLCGIGNNFYSVSYDDIFHVFFYHTLTHTRLDRQTDKPTGT